MNTSTNIHPKPGDYAEVKQINEDCWTCTFMSKGDGYGGFAIFCATLGDALELQSAFNAAVASVERRERPLHAILRDEISAPLHGGA